METGWADWLLFLVFLYCTVKAYGHLRDRHGTDDNNWLEGVGAFALAPIVAPFMPFIMVKKWLRERRTKTSGSVESRTV